LPDQYCALVSRWFVFVEYRMVKQRVNIVPSVRLNNFQHIGLHSYRAARQTHNTCTIYQRHSSQMKLLTFRTHERTHLCDNFFLFSHKCRAFGMRIEIAYYYYFCAFAIRHVKVNIVLNHFGCFPTWIEFGNKTGELQKQYVETLILNTRLGIENLSEKHIGRYSGEPESKRE
jgi:hypothetical protein